MELVIEGFQKLLVRRFSGRKITDIQIRNRGRGFGEDNSYVFTFGEIPLTSQSNSNPRGKSWESEFEVWLDKLPNQNGEYEMFVMGLHGVTCYGMQLSEVRSLENFSIAMSRVVRRCGEYWDTLC